MQIYVCHYKPLSKRKIYIQKMFAEMKLDFEFITDFDREDIKEYIDQYKMNEKKWNEQISLIKPTLLKNLNNNRNKKLVDIFKSQIKVFIYKIFNPKEFKPTVLSDSQISNTLKHLWALRKIKNLNSPALVIEDDIIAKENSYKLIEQAFELCSQSFDYVDLGGGCDLVPFRNEIPIKNFHNFVLLSLPRTRTTAGYMISPNAARILSEEMTPIIMPTDWQFNYLFKKHKFKVAWSDPPAFIHGSQSKHYLSSIN